MDEHIIESEDGKLWYGGGAWTDIRDKAKRYPSEAAARGEIDKFSMKGKPVSVASPPTDEGLADDEINSNRNKPE